MAGRLGQRRGALGAAALALVLCACDDIVLTPRCPGDVLVDPQNKSLVFPEVEAGAQAFRTLGVWNRSRLPKTFALVAPEPPFDWDLPPGQTELVVEGRCGQIRDADQKIRFRFAPGAGQNGILRGEARLVATDGTTFTIALEGAAIPVPIRCAPDSLFFGRVVVGEQRVLPVTCTNFTGQSVWIEVPPPQLVRGSRFVVDREEAELEIRPHQALSIDVRFTADGEAGPVMAFLPIREAGTRKPLFPGEGLELSGQVVPVRVIQYGDEVLGDGAADPALDFGFVPLGANRELSLPLHNLYDRPVEQAWRRPAPPRGTSTWSRSRPSWEPFPPRRGSACASPPGTPASAPPISAWRSPGATPTRRRGTRSASAASGAGPRSSALPRR
jgi:hypothetical protein